MQYHLLGKLKFCALTGNQAGVLQLFFEPFLFFRC